MTIMEGEREPVNVEERLAALPYVFRDPVRIDKQIDPRKKDFGSRIGVGRPSGQVFHTVREVRSPEEVTLGNGRVVRLLGVRGNGLTDREAVAFLEKLTRNQRVFLKFDPVKGDAPPCFCYLYLKNKTFVNAHLIRTGSSTSICLSSTGSGRNFSITSVPPPPCERSPFFAHAVHHAYPPGKPPPTRRSHAAAFRIGRRFLSPAVDNSSR